VRAGATARAAAFEPTTMHEAVERADGVGQAGDTAFDQTVGRKRIAASDRRQGAVVIDSREVDQRGGRNDQEAIEPQHEATPGESSAEEESAAQAGDRHQVVRALSGRARRSCSSCVRRCGPGRQDWHH